MRRSEPKSDAIESLQNNILQTKEEISLKNYNETQRVREECEKISS
jgi:hypothetical protein